MSWTDPVSEPTDLFRLPNDERLPIIRDIATKEMSDFVLNLRRKLGVLGATDGDFLAGLMMVLEVYPPTVVQIALDLRNQPDNDAPADWLVEGVLLHMEKARNRIAEIGAQHSPETGP